MKIEFDNALNEAGWVLIEELGKFGVVNGRMFNNIKPSLKLAIEHYLSESDKAQPIPQQEAQMNIDNLATQTQEEKEVLDGIKPVRLRDYQKGVSKETEWKNGEECLYMNSKEVHKFIGIDPTRNDFCYIKANCSAVNWVEVAKLSKPESPEEKESRERLEAAEELYYTYMAEWEFRQNWSALDEKNKAAFLAIVEKTNYRKEQ